MSATTHEQDRPERSLAACRRHCKSTAVLPSHAFDALPEPKAESFERTSWPSTYDTVTHKGMFAPSVREVLLVIDLSIMPEKKEQLLELATQALATQAKAFDLSIRVIIPDSWLDLAALEQQIADCLPLASTSSQEELGVQATKLARLRQCLRFVSQLLDIEKEQDSCCAIIRLGAKNVESACRSALHGYFARTAPLCVTREIESAIFLAFAVQPDTSFSLMDCISHLACDQLIWIRSAYDVLCFLAAVQTNEYDACQ